MKSLKYLEELDEFEGLWQVTVKHGLVEIFVNVLGFVGSVVFVTTTDCALVVQT